MDYLQLMVPTQTKSDNVVQQITEISHSLKNLARELDVPVLALSQLSRAVEQRGGRPRLSDLRDSGSIEQDADLVLFLYRDKERPAVEGADGEVIKLKLAKHRNGPTGDLDLWFKKSQTRFEAYSGNRFAEAS